MASTTFVNYQTVIDAGWLNDVNSAVYSGTFQASTITPTNVTSSGAISGATVAGTTSVTTPIVKSGTSLTLQTNGTTTAVTIDTSQRVGIGTTSPAYSLDVQTSGSSGVTRVKNTLSTGYSSYAAFNDLGANMSIGMGGSASSLFSGSAFIDTGGSIPLVFSTNDTERMRLDASGNLLIGTTTNTGNYKTNIYSGSQTTILLQSSAACADVWNNATSGNNVFFTFYTEGSGTARGSINYNRGAGLVAYNVTSDQRLKENITEASSALSKIDSIQIKSFDWIETKNKVDFGVIAQELQNVAPECVTPGVDNEDGTMKTPWAVDTSALIPAMIKAIQELSAKVTALEAKVGA